MSEPVDWRLDLSDRPLYAVQIMDGEPPQVAAWTARDEVHFFGARHGAFYAMRRVVCPPDVTPDTGSSWVTFLETLHAPNGAYLPVVDTGTTVIHSTHDGRLRVYQQPFDHLLLDADGRQSALACDGMPLVAVGVDRDLGTVGAVSADSTLHIFLQRVYVGAFALELDGQADVSAVLLPDAAGELLVVSTACIQVVDMSGQVVARLAAPASIGCAACSPDGDLVVTADREEAIIRVYDGDLHLLRQGSAADLLARAAPLQLLDVLPDPEATPEALAVANDGTLVIAVEGILCRTDVDALAPLPQPRTLF